MPRKYALELICDYLAACRTYGGNIRTEYAWWIKNCEGKIKMHPNTMAFCKEVFYYISCGTTLKNAVEYATNKLF